MGRQERHGVAAELSEPDQAEALGCGHRVPLVREPARRGEQLAADAAKRGRAWRSETTPCG